jgi:hypothetical protein
MNAVCTTPTIPQLKCARPNTTALTTIATRHAAVPS